MIRIFLVVGCCLALTASAQELTSNSTSVAKKTATSLQTAEADEFIYNIYKKTYEGRAKSITDFTTAFFDKVENPYPYVYALWFNDAVLGNYGKKDTPHQLELIERILNDPHAPGTMTTAAYYQKGTHFILSNDDKTGLAIEQKIGTIRNWQFVGPFENISRSGFYKDFGPLTRPEPQAEFISSTKAKVKWFTPPSECPDGWIALPFHFSKTTAVVYAQTFVYSSKTQEVNLNFGCGGAAKVWLNDVLAISDETERSTEFDAYTTKTRLQKGVNRILVQLSFTDSKYPNFAVRLTDQNYNDIPGLIGNSTYKPYVKSGITPVEPKKHFAEDYFIKRIEAGDDKPVNYLLLSEVYLRHKKLNEARELIEVISTKQPGNVYLKLQLVEILRREGNNTRMLEELSKLRQLDPNALLCLETDINTDMSNQRWEEAIQKIDKRISVFGENPGSYIKKIEILAKQGKLQEFTTLAEKVYEKYPDNGTINRIMFAIKREAYRDLNGALEIYAKFLSGNYDYRLLQEYSHWLINNGQAKQGTDLIEEIISNHPHESEIIAEYADYQFGTKNFARAEELISRALTLSPYHEVYWAKLGDIRSSQQRTKESIEAYNKSLLFNPNQFQVINKLRLLKGQSESHNLVPTVDLDKIIQQQPFPGTTATDAGYAVLHDETTAIVHNSGASEEFNTYVVKIINEAGIAEFKETNIGYANYQSLLIELAELIKPSGAHIRAERNQNQLVFTNLEAGDVIAIKYNIKNYNTGRFSDQYSSKSYFSQTAPTATKKYNLLISPTKKVNQRWSLLPINPTISDMEDFKKYTWQANSIDGLKEEAYQPPVADIAPVLHLSTIAKWQDIADWYADISSQSSSESRDLKLLVKAMFTNEELTDMSSYQKAKRIYEYILNNIRYSSVSFRQGAFVPQPAFVTLTTRLGDCKDLSSLFVRLCEMVGIPGRMVLVNTHQNGENDILLPCIDFNHCIAKVKLDQQEYYVELTDRYLPFTSLPNSLINSQILEIPRKGENFVSELQKLGPSTKAKDVAKTYVNMKLDNSDVVVSVKAVKYGHLSSGLRSTYADLSIERQFKTIEEKVAANYKNNVTIEHVDPFETLHDLGDSASIAYTYRVQDEVSEIGEMRTFKINYPDVIAVLSHFPSNTRTYPLYYNRYEDTDEYVTQVTVDLPEGMGFASLPNSENFQFGKMGYTLTYHRTSPERLEVTRKFKSDRNSISAADYPAFKAFLEKIVKAELKLIAYQ